MKKIVISVIFILSLATIATLYPTFYGTPWEKASSAQELKQAVEHKYDIEVDLKETNYNFKDGRYVSTFSLQGDDSLTFEAEKSPGGSMSDYYPEAVWVKEAKKDVYPVLKESFSPLSIELYSLDSVYGVGSDMNIKKNIPSYKDVDTGVDIGIHFKDKWTKKNEDILVKETLAFVRALQKKGVANLGVRLYLQDKLNDGKGDATFSISIENSDFAKVKTEADIKRKIETF